MDVQYVHASPEDVVREHSECKGLRPAFPSRGGRPFAISTSVLHSQMNTGVINGKVVCTADSNQEYCKKRKATPFDVQKTIFKAQVGTFRSSEIALVRKRNTQQERSNAICMKLAQQGGV